MSDRNRSKQSNSSRPNHSEKFFEIDQNDFNKNEFRGLFQTDRKRQNSDIKSIKNPQWESSTERTLPNENLQELIYNKITHITSKKKPDIYFGNSLIRAGTYRVYDNTIPIEEKGDEKSEGEVSFHSADYNELKKQEIRYFNLSSNITIKCYNCGEVGHMSRNCHHDIRIVCFKCNNLGHIESECQNIKCFKCHKIGHRFNECTVGKDGKETIMCEGCKCIGHTKEFCLQKPIKIKRKYLNECFNCGEDHLICPLSASKNDIILDYFSDEELISSSDGGFFIEKKQIELNSPKKKHTDSKNRSIRKTVYCPNCAHKHSLANCENKSRDNHFDRRRQYLSSSFYDKERENDRTKNYKISNLQKDQTFSYREDNYSSDENFDKFLGSRKHRINEKEVKSSKKYINDHENQRKNITYNNIISNSKKERNWNSSYNSETRRFYNKK